jgi:hypothetical protein
MVITGRRTPERARFAAPWVFMPLASARGGGWLLRIERGSAKVSMQPQASCIPHSLPVVANPTLRIDPNLAERNLLEPGQVVGR